MGSHKTPFSKKKLFSSPVKGPFFFSHLWFAAFIFQVLALCIRQSPRESLCSLPHRMGNPMSHTFATLGWDLPHKRITCKAEAQTQGSATGEIQKFTQSLRREGSLGGPMWEEGMESEDGRAHEGSGGRGSSKEEVVEQWSQASRSESAPSLHLTPFIQY